MYQVIKKQTGEVVAEAFNYSSLEWAYAGLGDLYFMRNATTGVEWDMPQ